MSVRDSCCLKNGNLSEGVTDSNVLLGNHVGSVSRSALFQRSWSVYRHLTASVRPKTLSCMTAGAQVTSESQNAIKNRMDQLKALQDDDDEIQRFVDSETFMERLKRTFATDPYIGTTYQRQTAEYYSRIVMGTFGVFGIIQGALEGREKFKEINKTTMFASNLMGYKRKTNHMVKCAMERGVKVWFKGSSFCLSFIALHQLIEIYCNKSTWWSLGLAYAISGSIFKITVGPRAMAATFVIGFVMGSAVGALILVMRKYAGETQEELNFQAVKAYYSERKKFNLPLKPSVSNEDDVEAD